MPLFEVTLESPLSDLQTGMLSKFLAEYDISLEKSDRKSGQLVFKAKRNRAYFKFSEKGSTLVTNEFLSLSVECLLARFDTLTGLMKREVFIREFENRFANKNGYFTLAILDIDHFKKVNDSFGHLIGDRILADFARIVLNELDNSCIAGRFGGEEFLIVVFHDNQPDGTELIERIRNSTIAHDYGIPDRINFSSGSVTREVKADNWDEMFHLLLEKADVSLYRAKDSGRGMNIDYDRLLDKGGMIVKRFPNHEAVINFGRRHGLSLGDRFLVVDRELNGRDCVSHCGDVLPRRIKGEIRIPHDPSCLLSESALVSVLYELRDWPVNNGDLLERSTEGVHLSGEIVSYRNWVEQDIDWLENKMSQAGQYRNIIYLYIEDADNQIVLHGYDIFTERISDLRKSWKSQNEGESFLVSLSEIVFWSDSPEFKPSLFKRKLAGLLRGARYYAIGFVDSASSQFMDKARFAITGMEPGSFFLWSAHNLGVLGQQLLRNRQGKKALLVLEKALSEGGDSASLRISIFNAYKLTGNTEKAVTAFSNISVEELNHLLWGMLGEVYFSAHDLVRAEQCFEKSLELDPEFEHVLNNLAHLYTVKYPRDRKKLKKALKMVDRALEITPEQPNYLDTKKLIREKLRNK